jgi:hypothetical protein
MRNVPRLGGTARFAGMVIACECYAAEAEAGLFTSSAASTERPPSGIFAAVGSGDQEVFTVLAGLEFCAEPERLATPAGPDLGGVLRIAILRRHDARVATSSW